MAKGIIYCTSTIVPGLVKIGKTGSDSFKQRMYNLEHNGYNNVVGLKREFAIEVEDYDEKENLIHEIFSKSRVGDSELFSLDLNLVIKLLSSLDGKQIYPEDQTKEEVFDNATEKLSSERIPEGIYYMKKKNQATGKEYNGIMKKENGVLMLCKGSDIVPSEEGKMTKKYYQTIKNANVVDEKLMEDIVCDSPSMAGVIVAGHAVNGWKEWKNKAGEMIDMYRKNSADN